MNEVVRMAETNAPRWTDYTDKTWPVEVVPAWAYDKLKKQRDDLLAALKKIVSEGDYTAPEGMKRIACDAIAKAEGRT